METTCLTPHSFTSDPLVAVWQVDKQCVSELRKKKKSRAKRAQYEVRSVDEITEEELENIAYRSKDKIWDKENVSHLRPSTHSVLLVLHYTVRPPGQVRFFTVFMFFLPGKLMSSVQTENSWHQNSVSQWLLCGRQRSVLWPVPQEPLRRGRTRCAARPGQC